MTAIEFDLTATSRVSVGMGPAVANDRRVSDVIPGSTVRGALATAYARDTGMSWDRPTAGFVKVFEQIGRFGVAIPEGYRLVRASEVQCKYLQEGCPTGWRDLAIDVLSETTPPRNCPSCGGPWAFGKRALIVASSGPPPPHEMVSTTRAALSVDGVAVQGQLFSRRAAIGGTRFKGLIRFVEEPPDEVVSWLLTELSLRVGGQRSVLGAMSWRARQVDLDPSEPRPRAVVTCLSPMIALDSLGGPTVDPEETLLRRFGLTVLARWVRPMRVQGWHAASGLPKSDDWALAPGSSFVVDGLTGQTLPLLTRGVGCRTVEGFGQVEVLGHDTVDRATPDVSVDGFEPRDSAPQGPTSAARLQPEEVASALNQAVNRLPTDQLRSQIGRAIDESIGRVAKLRRLGRVTDPGRVVAEFLDKPAVRQHLSQDAVDVWRWVLVEASNQEMKAIRNRLEGGPR